MRRILIVDDEPDVLNALEQALRMPEGGGHHVECCSSGEVGLARLKEASFDLLITDLTMPGMDGLTFLEYAGRLNPDLHRILITGFGSQQVKDAADRLAEHYLSKPFSLHELIASVQRVLAKPVAP